MRVPRGAGELSGFTDFIEDAQHHDDGLRAVFLVKSPDGLDLDVEHVFHPIFMKYSSYIEPTIGPTIGNEYHIYCRKYLPTFRYNYGGNMMSVAYDFTRETAAAEF